MDKLHKINKITNYYNYNDARFSIIALECSRFYWKCRSRHRLFRSWA